MTDTARVETVLKPKSVSNKPHAVSPVSKTQARDGLSQLETLSVCLLSKSLIRF